MKTIDSPLFVIAKSAVFCNQQPRLCLVRVWFAITCMLISPDGRSAEFQNLDFESATFVPIPNDTYDRVYLSTALPHWTGFVGTNQLNAVLHDNTYLGSSGIAILDNQWLGSAPLQGNFSVLLQAGAELGSVPLQPADVYLTQIGLVPMNAMSLRFRGELFFNTLAPGQFSLSLGGENLNLIAFPPDGNPGNLYGADISGREGQTLPLNITVFAPRSNGQLNGQFDLYLDSFQFSPTPVPEPSTLALIALGTALGLGSWFRANRRKNIEW